mgnify:CR=1 FL=1
MLKYILKRILLLIPVLIGATLIVFFVMDMTPGDPAVAKLGVDATAEQIEELREEMGLNDPFPVRYGRFVLDLVQGDLGTSYKTGLDVMQQIMQRIPYTFLLSFAALLFAVIVGIPAGIISARHQYTVFDNCTMVLTLIGASAPHFWLGLMGVIICGESRVATGGLHGIRFAGAGYHPSDADAGHELYRTRHTNDSFGYVGCNESGLC